MGHSVTDQSQNGLQRIQVEKEICISEERDFKCLFVSSNQFINQPTQLFLKDVGFDISIQQN